MYRVVSKYRNHRGQWVIEAGPWHAWRSDAEHWAIVLNQLGYLTQVEAQHGAAPAADDALRNALSDMA